MKIIITTILALGLNTAFASNILDCKAAAGYYGNLELNRDGTTLSLKAAQGFAYEISQMLHLPELAELSANFDSEECIQVQKYGIYCVIQNAEITATKFDGTKFNFIGDLNLKVHRFARETLVELAISNGDREGFKSFIFAGLDGHSCNWNF